MSALMPENRRRDEALRRYMLAADTLAAIAEMLVEADAPDSPTRRVVANSARNLELAKIAVRSFGADPYEPTGAGDDDEIVITPPPAAAPDSGAIAILGGLVADLDAMSRRPSEVMGPYCAVPGLVHSPAHQPVQEARHAA